MLGQIQKDNPAKVRIVYRHFPLPGHSLALISTQAAEAAGLQGKFWEMHDRIFEKQVEWSQKSIADMETWLKEQAKEFGLDMAKFDADLKSDALVKKAMDAQNTARAIGINSTPYLLINGRSYSGPRNPESLDGIIKMMDLAPRQYSVCPPMMVDVAKKYIATLKTEKGDIVLELYPEKAPMTVNSFVFLAKNGWFDGVTFHWVLAGIAAQTGDPTGTGFGGPGYFFENEITPDLSFAEAGMVGMANSGPGSNGSQFFITLSSLPKMDGKYTIFGKVISGFENAQKLTPRDTSTGAVLPPGDKILSVTIEEK